jgi:hypothetical protein
MAARAVLAELPAMFILMTGDALRGQAQEGPIPVLDLEGAEFFRRDKFLTVALLAGQGGVLALQGIPRLVVVESVPAARPGYNGERAPEVLGVASDAILPRVRLIDHTCVVTATIRQALLDFRMAIQALELRASSAQSVTRSTLSQRVE